MTNLVYRPDIDGLRTVAVVPVIVFHAGASWMPGGFVGVDIFFVISGYLISAIIFREFDAGEFSFLRFYERRLRRIIPALVVMLLLTVLLFQILALPDQAQNAAQSGIAALLSVSNFYFWQDSGYFAPTAEFLPFLHTWSLAVEEQFYVVFPVFVLIIWKLHLPAKWVMAFCAVAAFVLSLWLSYNKPSVAYYLLPARAWELALGAVLAIGVFPQSRGQFLKQGLPALGLAMILYSLFGIQSDDVFPGWVALFPCVGAALILHADGQSWVARNVLSARPMVFVGLLSYSLYLWHWPVLASFRVQAGSIYLGPASTFAAIALTILLAWASWRFVERPFRDKSSMNVLRLLKLLSAGSLAVLVVCGLSIAMAGFPGRLSEPARMALSASGDVDPYRALCDYTRNLSDCRFGNPDAPVTYAIIGDSHAAAIRPAVEASEIMGGAAGTLLWSGACPLLEGSRRQSRAAARECDGFKSAVWQTLETTPELNTIILAGRWPYQMTGWLPESGGSNRAWFTDPQTKFTSIEENAAVLQRSMARTIDRLSGMGLNVIVVGSVPEPGFDVPSSVAMARYAGRADPRGSRYETTNIRAGRADNLIASVVHGRNAVRFISIWQSFCGDEWCKIALAGTPLYYDDDHLSVFGAVEVAAPAIAGSN